MDVQDEADHRKAFKRYVRKGARRNKIVMHGGFPGHKPADVQRLYARLKNRKRVGGKRKKTT